MTKRLQFILGDGEYREIRRAARSRGLSLAEWVRQALGLTRYRKTPASVDKKLEAVRAAIKHEFPVTDVDEMLAEIEQGYASSDSRNNI